MALVWLALSNPKAYSYWYMRSRPKPKENRTKDSKLALVVAGLALYGGLGALVVWGQLSNAFFSEPVALVFIFPVLWLASLIMGKFRPK